MIINNHLYSAWVQHPRRWKIKFSFVVSLGSHTVTPRAYMVSLFISLYYFTFRRLTWWYIANEDLEEPSSSLTGDHQYKNTPLLPELRHSGIEPTCRVNTIYVTLHSRVRAEINPRQLSSYALVKHTIVPCAYATGPSSHLHHCVQISVRHWTIYANCMSKHYSAKFKHFVFSANALTSYRTLQNCIRKIFFCTGKSVWTRRRQQDTRKYVPNRWKVAKCEIFVLDYNDPAT